MAQNFIMCQFCEKLKDIKWKCFDCDLVLCQKCATRHSKFGGSEEHCIIDIKQVGTPENVDIIRKINLRNIRCETHVKEKCSIFCQDCKKTVCSFCVLEPDHKGHNLDKLSTVYSNQLFELRDTKERINENLPDLSERVKEATTTNENYNEIKQKIFELEKYLKQRVTKEAANLINKLDELFIPSKDAFMEETLKIQEKENKLKEMNNVIDDALKSHQATGVLSTIDKVDKHLLMKIKSDNKLLYQKFSLSAPDLSDINLGLVKRIPIFKFLNTYETNVYCINKLQSLKDGTLVCFYENRKKDKFIGYCDAQGDKRMIKNKICVSTSSWSPSAMTVTEDDMILLTANTKSNEDRTEIKCMSAYDKQFKTFETSNFPEQIKTVEKIYSINNEIIIVTPCYNVDDDSRYEKSRCGIIMIDKKGYCTEIDTMENLFEDYYTCAKKINDWKIYVIITGNEVKTVVVYDFRYKNLYNTWKLDDSTLTRKLNDLVTTRTPNKLIVVDDMKSIYFLSGNDEFLISIGEKEGINNPTSLHIDKSGHLLIGCKGDKNDKAKIHVVKIIY